MGIIKKFKDFFKSEPETKPKDPRELGLDYIKQHFQVLTDSATEIKSELSTYFLYDDKPHKVGAKHMRSYPCISIKFLFMGDEMSDFQKCAKWANKAADIFESETEFNVFVSSEEIKDWVAGYFDDDIRTYQNPKKETIGYSIDISIINKRLTPALDTVYRETFYYEKDENNISPEDNKQILKFIEDNLMWDFKDNDIDYSIYGQYDFNHERYKGIVISIYKSDNPGSEIKFDYYEDLNPNRNIVIDPFLYPILRRLYQKISDIIPCEFKIKAEPSHVGIQFDYLSSKINL